ncbi:MAG: pyridoxamine 5'-phosphate oxidase family protein, partial [[Clostridium] scindens]|uniref:pyridoxamine 5'-phosphate oxidase family protein n=1 Tax=Clostridium scindens (strain JCM 10418 / VPI 12708) TaxID=29347 RepID=UPI002B219E9F
MMKDPQQTIGNMADKYSTALISYIDEEGYPVTKAMLKPRERRGIKEFWFTTNTSSNKVKCFRKNPKASIYFVDKRYFRGASLAGTVEVLETPEAKERIWRDGDTMYY